MAKNQLPLKEVLSAVDKKDRDWYSNLSADDKKLLNPWLLMRYVSSSKSATIEYLLYTNLLVNEHYSVIAKHPELQWLLLTAVGQGKPAFHEYIKPPNSKRKKDKISEFLSAAYPLLKHDEIQLIRDLNTDAELKELAEDYGYDEKTIKEIFG